MYKVQKAFVIISIALLTFKCYGVRADEPVRMELNYRIYHQLYQQSRNEHLGVRLPIWPHAELSDMAKWYTHLMIERQSFSHHILPENQKWDYIWKNTPSFDAYLIIENLYTAWSINNYTELDLVHAWDISQSHFASINHLRVQYYGLYAAYDSKGVLWVTKYVARIKE